MKLFNKKVCTLLLAAAMTLGFASTGNAIDFKVKGMWQVGFGAYDGSLVGKVNQGDGNKRPHANDTFTASQRVRLQLEAIASENLSGTVTLFTGRQTWGQSKNGGALGADGTTAVRVRQAFIDWTVPDTALKLRMGLQDFAMPNAAGGSAVFDLRGAAVVANYAFNDNVGLTATWFRPFNDNYDGGDKKNQAGYLDNMDLFALTLPLNFDGVSVEPWVMYGMQGRNVARDYDNIVNGTNGSQWISDGNPAATLTPFVGAGYSNDSSWGGLNTSAARGKTSKAYGNMFWVGLPVKVTAFDPFNIEFDFNYGYVESMGRFDATNRKDNTTRRASTKREGWIAKALVEYKMDWGVPGIFGWYASGDDGNVKNGSERMPSIAPFGNFTSFMGDGNKYWAPHDAMLDLDDSYAGTWGLGLQVRDVSFVEDLSHTFRVAYWGGTNSPSMAKYMDSATAWRGSYVDGVYLTTNDGLLEFNLVNEYKVYENFDINFELGYIANFVDNKTWSKSSYQNNTSGYRTFEKQDAWKAQLIFTYKF